MIVELSDQELSHARIALLHRYWAIQHTAAEHRSEREDLNQDIERQLDVLRGLLARLMGYEPDQVPDGNGKELCRGCQRA